MRYERKLWGLILFGFPKKTSLICHSECSESDSIEMSYLRFERKWRSLMLIGFFEKNTLKCHSDRSEESRVLIGRILY
jgi:hypothetical protein